MLLHDVYPIPILRSRFNDLTRRQVTKGKCRVRAITVCGRFHIVLMEMTVPGTLYMIIERFKSGDPAPVYRRLRERGRMAPEGLSYVSSWITEDLTTCYQVMQTDDRNLLSQWMENWKDLVDFEVHPVVTSAQAADAVASRSPA